MMMPDTIRIAGGTYRIGDESLPLSRPVHDVIIDPFAIMVGTVTNHEFARFVSAGGYRQDTYWSEVGLRWRESKNVRLPAFWGNPNFDASEQPVVGVAWYSAQAYTAWLSEITQMAWRLPSEVEWEIATQADGTGTIHTAQQGHQHTIASIGEGYQSAHGAWNLLGNIWEWCNTRWGKNWQTQTYAYPYRVADGREESSGSYARVMRGGSWFDPLQEAHPSKRARYLPGSRGSNIGFRLVYTLT